MGRERAGSESRLRSWERAGAEAAEHRCTSAAFPARRGAEAGGRTPRAPCRSLRGRSEAHAYTCVDAHAHMSGFCKPLCLVLTARHSVVLL